MPEFTLSASTQNKTIGAQSRAILASMAAPIRQGRVIEDHQTLRAV